MSDNNIELMGEMIPYFLGALIFICIIAVAAAYMSKKADDKKKLEVKKVKIIEKLAQQGAIEWYVVETDKGERFRLRNFNADKIIIAVGDVGIAKYRGKTIVSFQRDV